MNGGPLWGEAILALLAFAAVFWFIRRTARVDRELGRQAFLDGLGCNPGWSEDTKQGWREARAEAEWVKLQQWENEARRHNK